MRSDRSLARFAGGLFSPSLRGAGRLRRAGSYGLLDRATTSLTALGESSLSLEQESRRPPGFRRTRDLEAGGGSFIRFRWLEPTLIPPFDQPVHRQEVPPALANRTVPPPRALSRFRRGSY